MFHIAEPGFVGRSSRLSDEAYADVLDNIVVCCADCAVIHRRTQSILLGKRRDEPAKDVMWIMGGRMKVGDDPRQTIQRVLMREIGLEVPNVSDINDLDLTISYVWEYRSQQPADRGCHMVGLYFVHIVDDRVRSDLDKQSSNENFSEFAWVPVIRIVDNPNSYHSGIHKLAARIRKSGIIHR